MKIKRINIVNNDNLYANKIKLELEEKLINNNFTITNLNPQLVITIGGDGSFLRMVKQYDYDSNIMFVGINAGTLGFLQEIKVEDIDIFIDILKNDKYKIEEVSIQETIIETNNEISNYYSLNEIVIREKDLNVLKVEIKVNDAHVENFVGDGILVATSVGSTAHNLSFGGSIVNSCLHTLQITPIAPLNNKSYRNLLNSLIIPEKKEIEIIPNSNNNNFLISIDGENITKYNVIKIKTFVNKKRIKCLRCEDYNFYQKINDKFLED